MLKGFVIASFALVSGFAQASQATETHCYNEAFNISANATISRKIAHSVFTGDYYILSLKFVSNGAGLPGGSSKTPDRPSNGKYYFRAGDGQYVRAIVDASVYTNGTGKLVYIKSGPKGTGFRKWTFQCK